MYFASRSQLTLHAESISKIGSRCVLCGQIVLDKARIKTHWRRTHPTAWKLASTEALRVCGSLKSIFRQPCQFCKSTAKNSNLHATQCSALFQVCAGQILRGHSHTDAAEADAKPPQPRSSAMTPAYMQVDNRSSPLATAFRAGAIAATSARSSAPASLENVEAASSRSTARPGSAAFIKPAAAQTSSASGCVRQTSILRFAAAAGASASRAASSSSGAEHPWPFRLRLRNPHQLCYVNSSTAMIHVLSLKP